MVLKQEVCILKMIQKDETKNLCLKNKNAKIAHVHLPLILWLDSLMKQMMMLEKRLNLPKKFKRTIIHCRYWLLIMERRYYYDLVESGLELDKKPWEYFYHQTGEMMGEYKNIARSIAGIFRFK